MFRNKSAWFSSSVPPACQQFWSKFIVFSYCGCVQQVYIILDALVNNGKFKQRIRLMCLYRSKYGSFRGAIDSYISVLSKTHVLHELK